MHTHVRRSASRFLSVLLVIWISARVGSAESVLILSSGFSALDNQLAMLLGDAGHSVTVGTQYVSFIGADLGGKNVALLLTNYNWPAGNMPEAGQEALVNFVSSGGGLITTEWTVWKWASKGGTYPFSGSFARLGELFPVEKNDNYGYSSTLTYTQAASDPTLNSELPASFTFPTDDIEGTEAYFVPRPAATVFYSSTGSRIVDDISTAMNGAGVVGWRVGAGHVLQLSTVMGPKELGDPSYRRLVTNAVNWAGKANRGPLAKALRFTLQSVRPGQPVSVTLDGENLPDKFFFDVRFREPGSTTNFVAINWQEGISATHIIPLGTSPGLWTVTGVRIHIGKDDHTGEFDPVAAVLNIAP
jgi:hypothetical protein